MPWPTFGSSYQNPMQLGAQQPYPVEPDAAAPQAYTPSLLGSLVAQHGAAPTSLVSSDMLKRLEKHSLLAAGLGLMAASHTRGANRWGSGLLAALKTGQDTYSGGLEDAEKQALLSRKTNEEDKISSLDAAITAKYPVAEGETPPQKVQRLTNMAVDYAQGGDHKTAQNLIATANALRLSSSSSASPFQYMQNNGTIYKIEKATGTVTPVAENELPQARLELRKQSLGLQEQGLFQRQGNQFTIRNKDLYERAVLLNQALLTVQDAKNGNPALYTSVIANFVQAADQKAQLRIQLLNYFKDHVDPSFSGTLQVMAERIRSGRYPMRILNALQKHMENLKELANKEWDTRRRGEIRRHPAVAEWIAPGEELFAEEISGVGDGSSTPDAAAAGTNPIDGF